MFASLVAALVSRVSRVSAHFERFGGFKFEGPEAAETALCCVLCLAQTSGCGAFERLRRALPAAPPTRANFIEAHQIQARLGCNEKGRCVAAAEAAARGAVLMSDAAIAHVEWNEAQPLEDALLQPYHISLAIDVFNRGAARCLSELQSHWGSFTRADKLRIALAAAVIAYCLNDSRLSERGVLPKMRAQTVMWMDLLSRLPTNTHAISKVVAAPQSENDRPGEASVQAVYQARTGYAVFLTASAINHACDANAMLRFESLDSTEPPIVQVVALRDVEIGEEICISYGPTPSKMPVAERQRILQTQYFFTCECPACLRERETVGDRENVEPGEKGADYADSRLDALCRMIENQTDVHDLQRLKEELHALCLLPSSVWSHPSRQGQCWDSYARICVSLSAYWEAATAVEVSIRILLTHAGFSENSVEIGREFVKAAQLHFNAGDLQKARSRAQQAQTVLRNIVPASDMDLLAATQLLQAIPSWL